MAEVTLSNVSKTYDGDVEAVQDASFTAADREFLVLVGPSGCGKSTVLRMVAGLETVTAGTISIDGKVVNDVPPRSRDIALVFQNYALYPHMTAFDNMAMGLKIRKMAKSEIRERVSEAARLLDIENLLNRRPGHLSGGQRQRVAVGRAIVRRPKVFLFDEPLSNLDPDMRVEMRTEISRLHQRLGATMIYVTHDQTEAMTMGDRIVVIRDGRIQQIASPLELYDRPVNRFVASFVGNPHMNLFRVSLERGHLVVAGQRLAVQGAIPADLAALEGRDLLLGIRPENLRLEDESPPTALWCEMTSTLDVVEPLGSETLLYWRLGDTAHVSRAAPTEGRDVGGPMRIRADLSRAHFFDPDTEQTVLSWPGAR